LPAKLVIARLVIRSDPWGDGGSITQEDSAQAPILLA
jgi:hypothetical protein